MTFLRRSLLWPLRLFAAVVSYSPGFVRVGLAWALALLWFDVLRLRRRVAIGNIRMAMPETSEFEAVHIARRSVFHLCTSIVEFCHFPFMNRERVKKFFVIEGLEHLDRALAEGKGVLQMSLHLGSGDFAFGALALLGYPTNLISKEIKTRWLNGLWFGLRGSIGTRFISHERSSFDILKALKRGEIVMFVLDQFMGPPVGVKVKFFGIETGAAAGLAVFADRTRAPTVPSYTYRRPDGMHVIRILPPIPFQDIGPREENIAVMTQVYTAKLEEIVRRYPDQWMWVHRRWKKFG